MAKYSVRVRGEGNKIQHSVVEADEVSANNGVVTFVSSAQGMGASKPVFIVGAANLNSAKLMDDKPADSE